MAEDTPNVVTFQSAAPSARLKKLEWSDARARCVHKRVQVWAKEPILECSDCGAVVDPYAWIRDRCRDWEQMTNSIALTKREGESEIKELKAALKVLRGEFATEIERRRAEHHLMVLPPQRRI